MESQEKVTTIFPRSRFEVTASGLRGLAELSRKNECKNGTDNFGILDWLNFFDLKLLQSSMDGKNGVMVKLHYFSKIPDKYFLNLKNHYEQLGFKVLTYPNNDWWFEW